MSVVFQLLQEVAAPAPETPARLHGIRVGEGEEPGEFLIVPGQVECLDQRELEAVLRVGALHLGHAGVGAGERRVRPLQLQRTLNVVGAW